MTIFFSRWPYNLKDLKGFRSSSQGDVLLGQWKQELSQEMDGRYFSPTFVSRDLNHICSIKFNKYLTSLNLSFLLYKKKKKKSGAAGGGCGIAKDQELAKSFSKGLIVNVPGFLILHFLSQLLDSVP